MKFLIVGDGEWRHVIHSPGSTFCNTILCISNTEVYLDFFRATENMTFVLLICTTSYRHKHCILTPYSLNPIDFFHFENHLYICYNYFIIIVGMETSRLIFRINHLSTTITRSSVDIAISTQIVREQRIVWIYRLYLFQL